MSAGLNRVQLWGHLGQDPEIRYTQSGTAVLNMRLATTEVYFDRDRNKKERTEWHSVVVWDKRAEALSKFLRKGAGVLVEGSLRTSSYEGKDGQKRYKTEVNAKEIILTDPRGGGDRGERGGGPSGASDSAPAGGNFGDGGSFPDDDEIPF